MSGLQRSHASGGKQSPTHGNATVVLHDLGCSLPCVPRVLPGSGGLASLSAPCELSHGAHGQTSPAKLADRRQWLLRAGHTCASAARTPLAMSETGLHLAAPTMLRLTHARQGHACRPAGRPIRTRAPRSSLAPRLCVRCRRARAHASPAPDAPERSRARGRAVHCPTLTLACSRPACRAPAPCRQRPATKAAAAPMQMPPPIAARDWATAALRRPPQRRLLSRALARRRRRPRRQRPQRRRRLRRSGARGRGRATSARQGRRVRPMPAMGAGRARLCSPRQRRTPAPQQQGVCSATVGAVV